MDIIRRVKRAWNAFREKDQENLQSQYLGPSYYSRPERMRYRYGSERSIINSINTRIAIDVAAIRIQHVKLDENDRYIETINSDLNYCLTTEANIDETSRNFFQDLVTSMCEEGVVAAVPEETTNNPLNTGGYDIKSLRVAKIVRWYPEYVRVEMYDKRDGRKKEITLPKSVVAIIPNPLYDVMNEPNSTCKRLVSKLNVMDAIDEKTKSGRLDMIVHLPYMTNTKMRKDEAERRRSELEDQLANSKYGIAYADANEKITQINRPIESNIMDQIEYLTSMLYSQLGMTKEVFDGTANEQMMLNYFIRTIEPIVSAICDEFNRKFLTKTARTQKQKIVFFRDLFRLAPIDSIIKMGQAFTQAAIMAPNEVRQQIGMKPSADPSSDELINRTINPMQGGMPNPNMEDPNMMDPNAEEMPIEGETEEASGPGDIPLGQIKVSDLP